MFHYIKKQLTSILIRFSVFIKRRYKIKIPQSKVSSRLSSLNPFPLCRLRKLTLIERFQFNLLAIDFKPHNLERSRTLSNGVICIGGLKRILLSVVLLLDSVTFTEMFSFFKLKVVI